MSETIYVYGDRAYSAAVAASHHPRVRERLARRVVSLHPGARLVFRVRDAELDWLTTDQVELHRLVARHPCAKVAVLPIAQADRG